MTIYLAVGINREGYKKVLGMFLDGILTHLKALGLEDILITAKDNLNRFSTTIRCIFPECSMQICVVHQIRNAAKYLIWKDKKLFVADMKFIYDAPSKIVSEATLIKLCQKMGS